MEEEQQSVVGGHLEAKHGWTGGREGGGEGTVSCSFVATQKIR